MPIVYLAQPNGARFHRSSSCSLLKTGSPTEIELSQVRLPEPCSRCYPDAPKVEVSHRYCYTCNTGAVMPCAHNGGILVTIPSVVRTPSVIGMYEVGDTFTRSKYVWPERAHHYLDS